MSGGPGIGALKVIRQGFVAKLMVGTTSQASSQTPLAPRQQATSLGLAPGKRHVKSPSGQEPGDYVLFVAAPLPLTPPLPLGRAPIRLVSEPVSELIGPGDEHFPGAAVDLGRHLALLVRHARYERRR